MAISNKKLWKLLIDKDLKKKDLEELAGISHYTVNKLNRGDNVTTDVLARICKALSCMMDDILEFRAKHNTNPMKKEGIVCGARAVISKPMKQSVRYAAL